MLYIWRNNEVYSECKFWERQFMYVVVANRKRRADR